MSILSTEQVFVDVLIIGAGGAGLRAACEAARLNASVMVVSKVPPLRSHTVAAQGGMNAALGNVTADDWRWHAFDTIRGSDWLADQDAVALMCAEAPKAIIDLEHLGMAFSRLDNGSIYQRAYGGQNTDYGKGGLAHRACTVADRTGHALMYTLFGFAQKSGVVFMQDTMAIDLLTTNEAAVCGALVWQFEDGKLYQIIAKQTIIASGGYGQAWQSTTASNICTGDGNAMALRAGACLQDMELVQFHPTSLYGTGILMSEAARGEGAYLLNGKGERFMERYAPKSMELASRDVICRAIMQEIKEGRGAGIHKDHVLLSMKHMPKNHIEQMLPNICAVAKTFARLDACEDNIPVLPAVHYTMGGVASNANCEVITCDASGTHLPIAGLLVIGEAACNSLHGANRLGCNSLLDLVVFGKISGNRAATLAKHQGPLKPSADVVQFILQKVTQFQFNKGTVSARFIKKQLQHIMHHSANMFRQREELAEGLAKISKLEDTFTHELQASGQSLVWNTDLLDALETLNLLQQARAVLMSADHRQESRGAHFRVDYPTRNDEKWLTHITYQQFGNHQSSLHHRPVNLSAPHYAFEVPPETRSY